MIEKTDGWSEATGRAGMTGGDGWMGYSSSSMHGMDQRWYAGQGGMADLLGYGRDQFGGWNPNHGGPQRYVDNLGNSRMAFSSTLGLANTAANKLGLPTAGTMLWNPWAGDEVSPGKYAGGWVNASAHLINKIMEKGYSLRVKKLRWMSAPEQTGIGPFDERGSELLNRWLSGEGGRVYLQEGVWGDYMRANGLLSTQIHNALSKDAMNRTGTGPVNIRMNAVIQNGYSTGYEMLHGTHAGVGGFEINGFATFSEGAFTYQVQMIWHDIIDPNPQYFMDTVYSGILSVLGPKDYEVHISWSDTFYKIKD